MSYDDLFKYLGMYGSYQWRVHVLLCVPCILVAYHKLIGVFMLDVPKHRCRLPFESDNATYYLPLEIINMTIPWDSEANAWSSCQRLDANFTFEYLNGKIPASDSTECDQWVYDDTGIEKNVVKEFDIVCNKAWLAPTGNSVFMLGDLLGSLLFGSLSDKYGRKPTFIFSLVLQVLSGLVLAFLNDIVSYMIVRVLIGMSTAGVLVTAYVIGMELVGPSKRLFAGVLIEYFWAAGYVSLPLIAYCIQDWRIMQIVVTVPGILFLSYWWFIPESARWLMAEGRIEESKEILLKAAKINKVTIPKEVLDHALETGQQNTGKSASVVDLMKHRNLRSRSFNMFFNWCAVGSAFYGLSWSTSKLEGNYYINFLLSGVVEIPAYTLVLLLLNRVGRKPVLVGSMLLASVTLLLIPAVPQDMNWLIVTLAMIGKFGVATAFNTDFIYTLELFPTVIRNIAVGISATCARFGSLVCPYINMMSQYWEPLPPIIFGGFLLIGSLLALLLPETLNKNLPDTIEDGEKFNQNSNKTVSTIER